MPDHTIISIDKIITNNITRKVYGKKSVGPRMEPRGSPALTGYSFKNFPSRTTQTTSKTRQNEAKYLTQSSIRPKV